MQRFNPLLCVLILFATLGTGMPDLRAEALAIDAEMQLQYARRLYEEGQFRRAAEEFDRFSFFFPDNAQRPMALLSAGKAFLQADESMSAMQRFQTLITEYPDKDDLEIEAHFMMAECYLVRGRPDQAVSLLEHFADQTHRVAVKDRAYLRITWILIDQLNWAGARQALERISVEGRKRRDIVAIENQLDLSDTISRKNPTLAGALSILPGGGQLYCGRPSDALAALVVNGGLFWAAYESFDNDLNALGGMLAIVGLGFYTANIYGAVSSAHKYNLRQQKGFVEKLKQSVRFSIGPGGMSSAPVPGDAVALMFRFTY